MTAPDLRFSSAQPATAGAAGVLATPKPCGECSLCCKLLDIAEPLNKPAGVWCRHFARGVGCGVHPDRPGVCRSYQCTWTWAGPLDERWRPDRAGFLINPGPVASELEIVVDPGRPDAWRREPYYSQIKHWSARAATGLTRVLVRARGRLVVVFPETEIDLGLPGGMSLIDSGYEMKDGRVQPYARFVASADAPSSA